MWRSDDSLAVVWEERSEGDPDVGRGNESVLFHNKILNAIKHKRQSIFQ